jgi:hypothetical protein
MKRTGFANASVSELATGFSVDNRNIRVKIANVKTSILGNKINQKEGWLSG